MRDRAVRRVASESVEDVEQVLIDLNNTLNEMRERLYPELAEKIARERREVIERIERESDSTLERRQPYYGTWRGVRSLSFEILTSTPLLQRRQAAR
jgi:hypothetical protein